MACRVCGKGQPRRNRARPPVTRWAAQLAAICHIAGLRGGIVVTKLTALQCELCNPDPEHVLWRDGFCRIVAIDEPGYVGFCRVILEKHMSEMSDLSAPERTRLMDAVFATEAALREVLSPDKINLASLGNVVPHLHWHVIPRFRDDPHFPRPIWAEPCRTVVHTRGTFYVERLARSLQRHIDRNRQYMGT